METHLPRTLVYELFRHELTLKAEDALLIIEGLKDGRGILYALEGEKWMSFPWKT